MKSLFHRLRQLLKHAIRRAPLSVTMKEKILFVSQLGYWPNFEHPTSFCEKLHARKLRERDLRLVDLSDKIKVREFVAKTIGEGYLIPMKFSGSRLDPTDLHALGDNIVIKRNDDSGSAILLKENTPEKAAAACRAIATKGGYGRSTNEWWYEKIPPKIIVEERMFDSEQTNQLYDYRFFIFASHTGPPSVFVEVIRRHDKGILNCSFFDSEMQPVSIKGERVFYRGYPLPAEDFPAKELFSEMKSVALQLSKDFSFVRVDLYAVAGKVYFGEMTFNPAEGRFRVSPLEFDFELGRKWELPVLAENLQPA